MSGMGGCGELAYELARLGLVDEVWFRVFLWVWGEGTRAFQEGSPPVRMQLFSRVTYPSGVVRLAYQPLSVG